MKKIFYALCILLTAVLTVSAVACGGKKEEEKPKDQTVAVSGVTLDKTEATLKIGESVVLTATVSPENATQKTVTWTSSSAATATVSDGTVTAVASGSATITASAGGKSATCTVNVLHVSDKVTIGDREYESLAAAVEGAEEGAVIEIANGTYTVDEPISLAKGVTLRGEAGYTTITTSSETNVITASAEGVVIEGIDFVKTDKTVSTAFSFIHAEKNALTVKNCSFTGQYADGDSEVVRAIVSNAGVSGYLIEGNTFKNVRQPAYLEGNGTVKNNTVDGTRGFVVCCNYKVTMEGNTFGENAVDIAVIENNGAENVYTEEDGIELSTKNNGAYVDLQPLSVKIKDGKKLEA